MGDVTEGESGGWEDGGASVNNMVVVEAVMHCSRDSTAAVRSGVSRISADITVGKAGRRGGGWKKKQKHFPEYGEPSRARARATAALHGMCFCFHHLLRSRIPFPCVVLDGEIAGR